MSTNDMHQMLPDYVNNDSLTIRKYNWQVTVWYGALKVKDDNLQSALYAMVLELQRRNVL